MNLLIKLILNIITYASSWSLSHVGAKEDVFNVVKCK